MNHTLESLLELAETDNGPQQIRVIVAELIGYIDFTSTEGHLMGYGLSNEWCQIPRFHASLDAIMPEVRKLGEGEKARFLYELERVCMIAFSHNFTLCRAMLDAEAIHLCIAFILTKQP